MTDSRHQRTPLQGGLGFRISRIARTLRASWEQSIKDLSLSTAQAAIIRALAEEPGLGLRETSRRLGSDPMHIRSLLIDLEHRGIVGSETSPQKGRKRPYQLTPSGRALAEVLNDRIVIHERRLAETLGPSSVEMLKVILTKLEQEYLPPTSELEAHSTPPLN